METRNCQNCKQDFTIEDEDFVFYQKIAVPPPTFCPPCRLQRRLVWMKGLQLFKRKCDLCGEMKFSMYAPDAPYTVYCPTCWWGDDWDPREFAREYNPDKTFLEQWNELLHTVPIIGLFTDTFSDKLSPYTNYIGHSKDCYLVYYSDYNEDSAYGYWLARSKNIYDCSPIIDCEYCYDSGNIFKSSNCVSCFDARHDVDCFFLKCSDGCMNCFGSANIKNKSYVFFNEQLTKEEYQEKLKLIDLGSYKNYIGWKKKAEEHFKKYPPRPVYDDFSTSSTGSYVFESRNCKECYEVIGCEDSKYLLLIKTPTTKDCYDYTDWGVNVSRLYECMTVGEGAKDIRFSNESGWALYNADYCKLCIGGSNLFGCIGMKKLEYCILNKQYSKEEYIKIREQIIEDMNANPYLSMEGHTYRYGEFFPPEFSPHAYNDTFASRFFPVEKSEIKKSMHWYEPGAKDYAITLMAHELPDHIKDVQDTVLKEVLGCTACSRGFKIIRNELQFLRDKNLPLPRECPFCRIWTKIDRWVLNMKLQNRICEKCGKDFKTHYSKERAPVVYCKECYQAAYL